MGVTGGGYMVHSVPDYKIEEYCSAEMVLQYSFFIG